MSHVDIGRLSRSARSCNIHRAYSIAYGQDIFGNWVVETTYGRIGSKGRTLVTMGFEVQWNGKPSYRLV